MRMLEAPKYSSKISIEETPKHSKIPTLKNWAMAFNFFISLRIGLKTLPMKSQVTGKKQEETPRKKQKTWFN